MQYDAAPDGDVFVVGSMTQLAHYVYQDYHLRIDALRAEAEHRHKLKVCCNVQCVQVFSKHGAIQHEACYMQCMCYKIPKKLYVHVQYRKVLNVEYCTLHVYRSACH